MLNLANMMQIQTGMYKLWSEGSVNTAVPKKPEFSDNCFMVQDLQG